MDIPSSPGLASSAYPLGSETSHGTSDHASSPRARVDEPAAAARRENRAEGITKVTDVTGENVREAFQNFILNYKSPDGTSYYINQIHGMRAYKNSTLFVDFAHFLHNSEWEALADGIRDQYYRFHPFLVRGLYNVIQKVLPSIFEKSAFTAAGDGTESVVSAASSSQASESDRVFMVAFYGLPLVNKIRDMHVAYVGKLSCISGTVTRTSEVRPELFKATFKCDACNVLVPDVEQHFKYTEPGVCPTPQCGNRSSWTLETSKSTFIDWQKVRIQENPDEIPTGSMPRTMDVILRGDVVERAKAGDKSLFTGSLTVVPDVSQFKIPGAKVSMRRDDRGQQGRGEGLNGAVKGLKELGARELGYRLIFMAQMVQDKNQQRETTLDDDDEVNQESYLESLSNEEREELNDMMNTDSLYSKLVNSIAPTVFGHEIIKKGILLQMMGGIHKRTPEGISLRGDINVCIVGDPSTSKSQFLKYVVGFMPRAVYTSGKASSAAGLTAAVVKDEESGEFTIEAGALMLADNGICAIDEFDKMDVRDQVAIHEAMEQQTISIAKAGIHATLNARASILAAANPVGGRYNHRLGLKQNLNMSAPIMSRFDVFFIVLDECDTTTDSRIADHIVGLHMDGDEAIDPPFSTAQMQRFIQFARTFTPQMTEEAQDYLVDRYNALRQEDTPVSGGRSYRITVRQLESLIRLSEAVARAHCSDTVTKDYVHEAYNLLRSSTIRVDYGDVNFEEEDTSLMSQRTIRRLRNPLTAHTTGRHRADPASQARNKITREKYNNMVNFIVSELAKTTESSQRSRATEDTMEDTEVTEDPEENSREALLTGWLETQEQLSTKAAFEDEKVIFGKVIKRMLKQNIILEVHEKHGGDRNEEDTMADETQAELPPTSENVYYVLHPNSAVNSLD